MDSAYFSSDGNYGSASEMIIVNTDNWTSEHWDLIDNTPDELRMIVAHRLSQGYTIEEAEQV